MPVASLNAVVATPGELWALRYPAQHALHVLDRPPGPAGLRVRSSRSSVHVPALDRAASVVVASERLDGETGWRMLGPGELAHVGPGLGIDSAVVVPEPPARLIPIGPGNPNIDT